jgi:hypothetical protein
VSMRWVDHRGYLSCVGYYRCLMYDRPRSYLKLPDLYIRMPLSIGAELCSELPRIHLPRLYEKGSGASIVGLR